MEDTNIVAVLESINANLTALNEKFDSLVSFNMSNSGKESELVEAETSLRLREIELRNKQLDEELKS